MIQEQWLQLTMSFVLGYNLKIFICWGKLIFGRENKNLVEGFLLGEIFPGRGNERVFG